MSNWDKGKPFTAIACSSGDMDEFDPGPVPDGLELDGDPVPKPKSVTITITELEGKRLSMTSSPSFEELLNRITADETLSGAEALAYHTLAYVVDKMSPAEKKPTIFVPKLIT